MATIAKPKKSKVPAPATREERLALAVWANRLLAERRLHDFVRQAWPVLEPDRQFVDNWHIEAECDHLEAVSDGRINQLLINVPPGTMKSLLVCVFWFCWSWVRQPGTRWMFASYSDEYSMRDSLKCRTLMESEWFRSNWGDLAEAKWGTLLPTVFNPVQIRHDQNQKGQFENTAGGWRMAKSTDGGTGQHPDFVVVDDPHKVNQAESDVERKSVIEWWDGTMSSRGVIRGVRRVVVMQRLHAGDLSAHLLDKGGWTHICLPMRYEVPEKVKAVVDGREVEVLRPRMMPTPIGFQDPRMKDGDLLWSSLYPEPVVADLEANLGLYHAAGQMQQRPTPRGGGKFKREWFDILGTAPEMVKIVRYWDKAGTAGGQGAQTAGVLMGQYVDVGALLPAMRNKYVMLDAVAGRWGAAEREKVILQTAELDKARWGHVETWVEQEPGSGGKESAENTVGNLAGFTCNFERVTGSKEVRADPLASQSSVGKVKMLSGKWNAQMLEELESFPLGKLKDMVDGASGAFNKLCVVSGAFSSSSQAHTGKQSDPGLKWEADELGVDDL